MLQRGVGGVMRAEFGIEVAQNSDSHGVAHLSIVLEDPEYPAARSAGSPAQDRHIESGQLTTTNTAPTSKVCARALEIALEIRRYVTQYVFVTVQGSGGAGGTVPRCSHNA